MTYAKCPECGSTEVSSFGPCKTLVGYPSFRDENGQIHHHDDNCIKKEFRCQSCKYRWSEAMQPVCATPGCDWRGRTRCDVCGYDSVVEEFSTAKLGVSYG